MRSRGQQSQIFGDMLAFMTFLVSDHWLDTHASYNSATMGNALYSCFARTCSLGWKTGPTMCLHCNGPLDAIAKPGFDCVCWGRMHVGEQARDVGS